MFLRLMIALGAAIALIGPAQAAVVDAAAGGFSIEQKLDLTKTPEQAWTQLVHPERWWSPAHTYSGEARNLKLDARAGGCWCEVLQFGSVEHQRVAYVDKGKILRLIGGLGPLQGMATGALTFLLAPREGGSTLTVTYRVWGYEAGGLDKLAAPVDGVLGEQTARLKALIETGKAAP